VPPLEIVYRSFSFASYCGRQGFGVLLSLLYPRAYFKSAPVMSPVEGKGDAVHNLVCEAGLPEAAEGARATVPSCLKSDDLAISQRNPGVLCSSCSHHSLQNVDPSRLPIWDLLVMRHIQRPKEIS
jgi:hypothetical protein